MSQVIVDPGIEIRSRKAVIESSAALTRISRRSAMLVLGGAALMPILPITGLAAPNLHIISRTPRKGIIVVMDITIPSDAG